MYKHKIVALVILFLFTFCAEAYDLSNKFNFRGGFTHNSQEDTGFIAAEYFPGLKFEIYQKKQMEIDCFAEGQFDARMDIDEKTDGSWDADIYRLWLRSTNPNSELRLGLQKINFGSATFFRPLQWFDNIDPRDSQNRTEGVLGLLLRYYLMDNSNFWFWGILDGDDSEYLKSKEGSISTGARMQLPILGGEVAISYHQRALGGYSEDDYIVIGKSSSESKYGFDGRWDYIAGFWLESSWSVLYNTQSYNSHSECYTLGSDYTFSFGNGIHVLGEMMFIGKGEDFFQRDARYEQFYVISSDTPIGLYDTISGLALYNSISEDIYYYLSYGMTFDYFKLNVNLTLSPNDSVENSEIGFSNGKSIEIEMQIDF